MTLQATPLVPVRLPEKGVFNLRIVLSADDFNTIMKTCKPFIAHNGLPREIFRRIRLVCDGEKVTASALNGAMIIQFTVSCIEGSDECELYIPYAAPVKNCKIVIIEAYGDEITVDTGNVKQTYKRIWDTHPDVSEYLSVDGADYEHYFDAKKLADALSAFGNEAVNLNFFQNRVVITSESKCGLVMALDSRRIRVKKEALHNVKKA